MIRLWVDDVRPAPNDWHWCRSVNGAKEFINICMKNNVEIDIISLDHDAGLYAQDGGDFIELLNWFEQKMICVFPIHIHSMNPVGIQNMRRIIERNGWKEIR